MSAKKKISQEEFEKLCALQCTQDEFCGWFECADKTLEAFCKKTYGLSFADAFERFRGKGKISLRRMQWRMAESSAAMGIWLGKQYLGQTDKIQVLQPNPQMDALLAAVSGLHEKQQAEEGEGNGDITD